MNGFLEKVLGYRESVGELTVQSVILCLLLTFLLSQVIAWVYVRTHRGVSYSGSIARSLIVLAMIVALVMLVIGNNIARAFGLFGALALIRFRTPVKDTNDTVFLFLAVAIGIAAGTGNLLVAFIGTLLISLIFVYLYRIRFGNQLDHDGLLRFQLPTKDGEPHAISEILDRYCRTFKLLHVRETEIGPNMEFAYQISMIDPRYSSHLVSEMAGFEGLSHLSLLIQDSEVTP